MIALATIVAPGALVTGALTGLAYGVLAVGVLLIHRATGIINLAQAETGSIAAAVLAKLVIDAGVPWAVALPIALAVGALTGVVIEAVVIRRLSKASSVVALVATIGVAQVLLLGRAAVPAVSHVSLFPTPLDRTLHLGSVTLRSEHFLALALLPAAVVGLSLFLDRTPTGLAIRAVADDPDAAQLAGISTRRVAAVVWGLAGALAALTAVLVAPLRGEQVGRLDATSLGAGLLLRALAAGLAGRLRSLPLALLGGIAVGVVEASLLFDGFSPGTVEAVLFAAVLGLVLLQRSAASSGRPDALVSPRRPPPAAIADRWWVRRMGAIGWSVLGAAALALPLVVSDAAPTYKATLAICFAIVGLSVVVLTGWAGQLSLAQFALAGIGAFTCAALTDRGVPFPAAVAEAAIAGTIVALVVGVPALRVRGLFLAVATLAAAVAGREALFTSHAFAGAGGDATVTRGRLLGIDLGAARTYYYLCLCVLAVSLGMIGHVRRTGIGRRIIAVRDDERRAAALGVAPAGAKLTAFGLAGALASLGGALYGGLAVTFGPQSFQVDESFRIVALSIIGGVGSVGGAALGALYLLGVPALVGGTAIAVLATSGVGVLVLLLYLPGGLVAALDLARGAALDAIARRVDPGDALIIEADHEALAVARSSQPGDVAHDEDAAIRERRVARSRGPRVRQALRPRGPSDLGAVPIMEAIGIRVAFGGTRAVDGVDLTLAPGEVLGLIGPNGAGKSTLLAVLGGDLVPGFGVVRLGGGDITGASPPERCRSGVGRSFQNPRMFAELTVLETLCVALEAHEHSELIPSLLGLRSSRDRERRHAAIAADVIDTLGLGRYARMPVGTLSTGTRRIVELGCLLAQRPRVLLLDEPTAGLAQRETEAFAPLLTGVRAELDAAMVLVEHDVPLVTAVSDRVQCLAAGRTIAITRPGAVRRDPAVIAAYLGDVSVAIERSRAASGV